MILHFQEYKLFCKVHFSFDIKNNTKILTLHEHLHELEDIGNILWMNFLILYQCESAQNISTKERGILQLPLRAHVKKKVTFQGLFNAGKWIGIFKVI